jgi:hypothetical protein
LISNNLLLLKILQNKIKPKKAYPLSSDEKEITLKAKIPVNKAGGGLVYNKMERYYSFSGTENGFTQGRNREKVKISRAHQCAR